MFIKNMHIWKSFFCAKIIRKTIYEINKINGKGRLIHTTFFSVSPRNSSSRSTLEFFNACCVCSRYLVIMCSNARWWSSSETRNRIFSECISRNCGFSWLIWCIICILDLSRAKLFNKSKSSLNYKILNEKHRNNYILWFINKRMARTQVSNIDLPLPVALSLIDC